jgi:hypothetical protein
MAIPNTNIKISAMATEIYGSVGTNRKLSGLATTAVGISGPPYKWTSFKNYTQPTLSVSPGSLAFDLDGVPDTTDQFTITVATPSQTWSITDDMVWCTQDVTSGSGTTVITVSVAHNSGAPRLGTITISSPGIADAVVGIDQSGL